MRLIEDQISTFVKTQFPSFYQEDGPNFIEFAKEYYKWMESSNNALYYARNLFEFRDIDTTIDDFIIHFKEKYLKNFPLELAQEDARFLVKHVMDFYRAKGSQRSYEIFFKSAFNIYPSFYYPKEDLFKLSDGTWYKPDYLEVNTSEKLQSLKQKEIIGSISRVKAFVEDIVTKRVNGRFISVVYISNADGVFTAGEIITPSSDQIIEGYPKVIGSLSTVDIITGGENFAVGDVLNIISGSGIGGKLRVTAISSETGVVKFTLIDGGFGYTNTSQVLVSTKVLDLAGNSSNIKTFDTVVQPLANITFNTSSNTFVNGDIIEAWYSNGTMAGNAVALVVSYVTGTTGSITVSTVSGNIANGNSPASGQFFNAGNTKSALTTTYTNITASANVIGSNATSIGVVNVVNQFVSSVGNYIYSTNGTAVFVNTSVQEIGLGSGATFKIGLLTNLEAVRLDSTFLRQKNISNVAYMDIICDASNSNAAGNTGYGFPKAPGVGPNGFILDALDISDQTIGTIASLVSVDGGQEYTKAPFVTVYEPRTAGYDKKELLMQLNAVTSSFGVGDIITQTITKPVTVLTVTSLTGNTNVEAGEFIYQGANVATGFVYTASLTGGVGTITVSNVTGTFNTLSNVKTLTSVANIAVSSVNSAATIAVTDKGLVRNVVTINTITELTLRKLSLSDTFAPGNTVVAASGATGNIQAVAEIAGSRTMGNNATVFANVVVANNTVISADVYDSGIGYIEDEFAQAQINATSSTIDIKLHAQKQGVGAGRYLNTKGFLDYDKYIHDGNYYQEYSYEVQTPLPFDKYSEVLKQVVHTAGTKMFGAVTLATHNDVQVYEGNSSISY